MSAKGMDFVICAAGEGTRLRSTVNRPKPLIKLKGKSLLEWSLDSFDFEPDDQVICIVQAADRVRASLESLFSEKYAQTQITWIELQRLTQGQLETALTARRVLRPSTPTAIFNADTYFYLKGLRDLLSLPSLDGIIPCSRERGDEWSFCAVGPDGHVTDVAEKQRISDLASVGFYGFSSSELFLKYADLEIANPSGGLREIYVAPLYSRMIADHKKILAPLVDEFRPMGTLAQLETYWSIKAAELKTQNGVR